MQRIAEWLLATSSWLRRHWPLALGATTFLSLPLWGERILKVIKAFWEAKEAKASAKKAEEELRKLRESHGQGGPFEEIPLVIVEYQCDGMDQGERWKPFTVRNLGAPAFSAQIQDVATDWGVVRFGLVPQLLRDEQVTVEAQVQSDAGTHRDFIRFLEDGGQKPGTAS